MGDLQTLPSVNLASWIHSSVVAVAYSGGRDSTALLHAICAAASAHPQQTQVVALHVHHGLSVHADSWLAHAQSQCAHWRSLGAPLCFLSHRLHEKPQPGQSVEAWARERRYAALQRMAMSVGAQQVFLAHHQRDQAETFLLQALRGAAMAGLSAMPVQQRDEHEVLWSRPWLGTTDQEIQAYVEHHRLTHIVDNSNADLRFARNRLRLQVWPALRHLFPEPEAAFAFSAQRAQEAQSCLDDLAQLDLELVAPQGPLLLASWSGLSVPRRGNALRAWLRRQPGLPIARSLINRLLHELNQSTAPACWPVGSGELQRFAGQLTYGPRRPQAAGLGLACPPAEKRLVIDALGEVEVPEWGGSLEIFAQPGGGLAWCPGWALTLKPRRGGEQFQAKPHQGVRSLKKHFQAARVPPWQRSGPLIFQDKTLVFVPGLGLDARALSWGPHTVGLRWKLHETMEAPCAGGLPIDRTGA